VTCIDYWLEPSLAKASRANFFVTKMHHLMPEMNDIGGGKMTYSNGTKSDHLTELFTYIEGSPRM